MRIAFAAGGTGGHLYPAIALADALRERASIRFIGSADRMEARIVPDAGYQLTAVASGPLQGRSWAQSFRSTIANAIGTVQALRALRRFRPDVVIATGGYVCFPVMLAARMLRTAGFISARLALLEPNAELGLTNRMLLPLVDEVWGAYPPVNERLQKKFCKTGVPVRPALLRPHNRVEAARRLGLWPGRRTILVFGGSLGARSVNVAVAALVTRRALPDDWQILHVSGERDYAYMQAEEAEPFGGNAVKLVPYLSDPADAYAVADLVIARAGASTLAELAAVGVPALLVPYPRASEDHQMRNARAFAATGAATVLPDADLNADALWWALREMMAPERLSELRYAARALAGNDAVATIAARIDALISRKDAA